MNRGRQVRHDVGLVPIADRLRWMRLFRLFLVAVTWLAHLSMPDARGAGTLFLAGLCGAYLLVSMTPLAVWAARRDTAVRMFGVSLLGDGVFLALAAYSPLAAVSPLRYLVLLHIVAVCLLASFRTALKLAIWHTLLFAAEAELRRAGTLPPVSDHTDAIAFVAAVWLVTLTTATFAAVNERELRRRGMDLQSLTMLGAQLQRTNTAASVGAAAVSVASATFRVDRVLLLAVHGEQWTVLAAGGTSVEPATGSPSTDQIVEHASRTRQTVLVRQLDEHRDPWLWAALPQARNVGLVPLHADGELLGLLVFEHTLRRGSRIEQRTITLIEQYASQISLALANVHLVADLSRLATVDGLTGAANRRSFEERLAAETAVTAGGGGPLSLIMVDVDHFKQVNDVHGHAVGDQVLRHVVGVLRAASRHRDLVARYGGEEFAVLLPDTDQHEAREIGERYRGAVETAPDSPAPITASLGVATMPADGASPGELAKAADEALYRAKREGRNRVVSARALTGGPASAHP